MWNIKVQVKTDLISILCLNPEPRGGILFLNFKLKHNNSISHEASSKFNSRWGFIFWTNWAGNETAHSGALLDIAQIWSQKFASNQHNFQN